MDISIVMINSLGQISLGRLMSNIPFVGLVRFAYFILQS